LDSVEYRTRAGASFAEYLYDVTKSELRGPSDVVAILLGRLYVELDGEVFGRRSAERATSDIAAAISAWLRYLGEVGYVRRFHVETGPTLDGDLRGAGAVWVTVETPDGAVWRVELVTRGTWIKPRLVYYGLRCANSQN